jgi:outer membrane protein TolC
MKRRRSSEPFRRHAAAYVARLVLAGLLLVAPTDEAASQADTLRYDLDSAIQRALEASPEVSAVAARRDFASARAGLARASRYLTEFTLTSAHAPAPGLDNPNGTTTDQLFLDPDVRNDWSSLRPFNEVEVEFLQPLYTWGELGGNIRAATSAVVMEDASIRDKEIDVAYRTERRLIDCSRRAQPTSTTRTSFRYSSQSRSSNGVWSKSTRGGVPPAWLCVGSCFFRTM